MPMSAAEVVEAVKMRCLVSGHLLLKTEGAAEKLSVFALPNDGDSSERSSASCCPISSTRDEKRKELHKIPYCNLDVRW